MCSQSVNALFRCVFDMSTLISISSLIGPAENGMVGQKMLCKFLWQARTTIYGIHAYVWFIDQDALVWSFQSQSNFVNCPTVIRSPNTCSFAWRVTTSETLNPGPSFIFIAFVVTFALITAATTLLLLCGVGDWGSLKGYTRQHTVATYILSSAFLGVVELTTQLLRLISIL